MKTYLLLDNEKTKSKRKLPEEEREEKQ